MPNVELIGFSDGEMDHLERQIFKFFREEAFAKDLVITCSPQSSVTDASGAHQPFVRVYDTNAEQGNAIASALSDVGLDVEVIHLVAFHPAAKLQEPHPFSGPLWRNTSGAWPRRAKE